MFFSVVITNYNYEQFLSRCLRSVLEQSLSKDNYEIIVVDDASTDQSKSIIAKYSNEISAIYLENNVGLASASNIGIKSAKGRYIVRLDSDDFVHNDFLSVAKIYMELCSDTTDALAIDYLLVDDNGNNLGYGKQEESPIACSIVFKSEILIKLNYYKEGMRIDEEKELFKRFKELNLRMNYLPIPLYRYTQHNKSLSKAYLIR